MEDKKVITEEEKVEKQKLLYDLSYKQYSNFYNELPDLIRERVVKLMPLYAAVLGFAPLLFIEVFASYNSCKCLPLIFSILSSGVYILSVYFAATIYMTKSFATFTPGSLKDEIQKEDVSIELSYKIVVKHLIGINKKNEGTFTTMSRAFKWSFISFFVSVILGIITYTIVFVDKN